jgi:hypothetical protein
MHGPHKTCIKPELYVAHAILCKFYVGALCHFYARHKTEFYAEHKIYINLALCGRYAGFTHRFFCREAGGLILCHFYAPHNNLNGSYGSLWST